MDTFNTEAIVDSVKPIEVPDVMSTSSLESTMTMTMTSTSTTTAPSSATVTTSSDGVAEFFEPPPLPQTKSTDTKIAESVKSEDAKIAESVKSEDAKIAESVKSEDAKIAESVKSEDAKIAESVKGEEAKIAESVKIEELAECEFSVKSKRLVKTDDMDAQDASTASFVEVDIVGVSEDDLPLLNGLLLPLKPLENLNFDSKSKVATTKMSSMAAAKALVEGKSLLDFTCRFKESSEKEKITAAATTISTSVSPLASRKGRVPIFSSSERVPINPEDPFFIITDIAVASPLFLAYLIGIVFVTTFF